MPAIANDNKGSLYGPAEVVTVKIKIYDAFNLSKALLRERKLKQPRPFQYVDIESLSRGGGAKMGSDVSLAKLRFR